MLMTPEYAVSYSQITVATQCLVAA